jgi:DNA-directed RNA polymerase II subunit RPB2
MKERKPKKVLSTSSPYPQEKEKETNGCECEKCAKKSDLEFQWDLIARYFEDKGFTHSQIQSYNELIHRVIPEVIDRMGTFSIVNEGITTTYTLKDPTFVPPCHREFEGDLTYVTPSYCTLRDLTYQSNLFCKLQIEEDNPLKGNRIKTVDKILIAQLPVMIKSDLCKIRNFTQKALAESGECMYEYGGYFIVNGQSKCIIGQERLAHNQVFCYHNAKTGNYTADIRCIQEGVSKAALMVQIRYGVDHKTSKHFNQATLQVTIPYTKREFPVMLLFRAFGVCSQEEIISFITPNRNEAIIKLLEPSFDEALVITDQESALAFMSQHLNSILPTQERQQEHLRGILTRDVFPHVGQDITDDTAKAFLLGHAVNKCLSVFLGELDTDDRDHFGNKRIDLAGNLIGTLFRIAFNRVMKEFKKKMEKTKTINSMSDFDHLNITKQIRNSLSTGNWGSNSSKSTHTGVTQQLQRITYISTLAHLRRFIAPIAKEGKCAKPRQLHNSSIFLACPSDTPESDQVGLIKNMAMLMEVSVESSGTTIRYMLREFGGLMKFLPENKEDKRIISHQHVKVFVNGKCMGLTDKHEELFLKVKHWKMRNEIPFDCGIIYNQYQREINIVTDGGRAIRPLLYVEGRDPNEFLRDWKHALEEGKSWKELCEMQLVEYIDSREAENALVAMTIEDFVKNPFKYKYTHLEIHPAMLLGACASTIPYSNHTQAPRVSYQSSQMKQAIGSYALNYSTRYDALSYVMHYPQKPIVTTRMGKMMKIDEMPAGANCVVAIMCHTGLTNGLAPVV